LLAIRLCANHGEKSVALPSDTAPIMPAPRPPSMSGSCWPRPPQSSVHLTSVLHNHATEPCVTEND